MNSNNFIKNKFVLLLPFIAAVFAGVFYILSELFGSYGIEPYVMGIFVNIMGGLFLLLISYKKIANFKIEKKDLGKLFISALFGFALGYFFLYQAINFIGSSKTSFLAQVEPIFIFLLSILFLGEKFSFKNLLSLVFILLGVLIILFDPSILSINFGVGELYSVISGLCFAIGIGSIASIISKYNEFIITGLQMLLGGTLLFGFAPIFGFGFEWKFLLPLGILGIIIGLSRLFYNLGLKFIGASKTAIVYTSKSFIIFLFAIVANYIFSGASFKLPQNMILFTIGGIVIFGGIALLKYEKINHRKHFFTSLLSKKKLFEKTQTEKNKF